MSNGTDLAETLAFIAEWPANCPPGQIELAAAYQRQREALRTIQSIVACAPAADRNRTAVMFRIDQPARPGLAP